MAAEGQRPSLPRITLIVARARNGVIGLQNTLPWHLPEDLRHFKAATIGHAVVMGRKTFDSIGRPLPGRRILVLTRSSHWHHPGCEHAASIDAALDVLKEQTEIFIAGGAEIYRQAIPFAQRILITDVDLEPEGDAWFDEPDPELWECVARTEHVAASGLRYSIRELRHRAASRGSATIDALPL